MEGKGPSWPGQLQLLVVQEYGLVAVFYLKFQVATVPVGKAGAHGVQDAGSTPSPHHWTVSGSKISSAPVEPSNVFVLPDPARELKVLISNLLELLTEVGVSGQGRDNALTLLIKVVPRKSPKDPNNSLTLWVIDQGK